MSAHAISAHVIRTARAVLSIAARNAQERGSVTYSRLLASLLYEEMKKEVRRTDEVDSRDVLSKAIDYCQQATNPSLDDAVEVLRAVLELLETGVRSYALTPQERRGQFRLIKGGLSASLDTPPAPHSREVG